MKTLLFLLCSAILCMGCHVYKPMEKAGYHLDPGLSATENMQKQLNRMQKGERLQLDLKNEKQVTVTFLKVDEKKLYANYYLPRNRMPVEIPIEEIEVMKVSKFNFPLTGALIAAGVAGVLVIIDNSIKMGLDGFTIPVL